MSRILMLLFLMPIYGVVWAQAYDLPLFVIETQGQAIPTEPKIMATLKVIHQPGGNRPTDAATDYQGPIGIEIRGQTSASFDKKGYGIELRKSETIDTNVSLLGLPAEADWVLHGPFIDKTLIRNALAHYLYQKTGRYSSRTRFVELILNGGYQGVYLLEEKAKRDKNRVNIKKLEPTDFEGDALTGGYIFRIDKSDNVQSEGFLSSDNLQIVYHYPKKTNITSVQETYLKGVVNGFESLIRSSNWADPVQGYASKLDVDAAVDYLMHEELTKNSDAYFVSFYMFKNRDSEGGKIQLGPPWDFNLAFGAVSYNNNMQTSGWQADQNMNAGVYKIPSFVKKIFNDPPFRARMKTRWAELRNREWHTVNINHFIDSLALHLQAAAPRNFQRWNILGSATCVNLSGGFGSFCFNGYSEPTWELEISHMRQWFMGRIAWMDQQFQYTEPAEPIPESVALTPIRSNFTQSGPLKGIRFNGSGLSVWTKQNGQFRAYQIHGRH